MSPNTWAGGNTRMPRGAAKQLIYTVAIFSTALMVLALVLRQHILRLVFGSIEPAVMDSALEYFLSTALAYPFGFSTTLSEALCRAEGIRATVTTESRSNTVIKGLPQCLYGMGRYTVTEISGEALLELLEG